MAGEADTQAKPGDDKLMKITLMLCVALMVGGLVAAVLQLNFGGVLFALGLALLSSFAGIRSLALEQGNTLLGVVFMLFGLFLFWLLLAPYLNP
jgi:hypothetical protein